MHITHVFALVIAFVHATTTLQAHISGTRLNRSAVILLDYEKHKASRAERQQHAHRRRSPPNPILLPKYSKDIDTREYARASSAVIEPSHIVEKVSAISHEKEERALTERPNGGREAKDVSTRKKSRSKENVHRDSTGRHITGTDDDVPLTNLLELFNDGERVDFQIHGHKGPRTYVFGFDTGDGKNRQYRLEERRRDGSVKGQYGYYDAKGKLKIVKYDAAPSKSYQERHHERKGTEN